MIKKEGMNMKESGLKEKKKKGRNRMIEKKDIG